MFSRRVSLKGRGRRIFSGENGGEDPKEFHEGVDVDARSWILAKIKAFSWSRIAQLDDDASIE